MMFAATASFVGCSEDDLDSKSIFDTNPIQRSEFDNWLLKNYVQEFNINFLYHYNDKEADQNYNVTPAQTDKAIAIAKLMQHMWLGAYVEDRKSVV